MGVTDTSDAWKNHYSPTLDRIAALVVEEFKAAPCAVVACGVWCGDSWVVEAGAWGELCSGGSRAEVNTIFDLASLTKPFTALALARLVRSELVDWTTAAGVLVRECIGTPSASVPLELLAAHRAGLEAHRKLYEPLVFGRTVDAFEALREAAMARRQDCAGAAEPSGFAPVYSDLGYLLLGEGLARACGSSLDLLVQREVSEPLGLSVGSARQLAQRDPSFIHRVAPTENVAWRGGVVRGEVHDENAWALGGEGICGHAGLFGTALDVAKLGMGILDVLRSQSSYLCRSELECLIKPRQGGTLRAGFDGKSGQGSSAGAECSDNAFGHLGFTGTSMWIDPDAEMVVVLLSNRVHPTRTHEALKVARPHVHDALFRWARQRRNL